MAQSREQSLPLGATIGVYEIKEVIRSDSLGFTYRAWNEHLNAIVTLKEYFPDEITKRIKGEANVTSLPGSDRTNFDYGLSAFVKQAELLADTPHPNIVSVHNVVKLNNTAYIATDLEQGSVLSSNKIKPLDAEEFLRTLLDTLKIIHDKGIVHGDICPNAILIKANGKPILRDFSADRLSLAARTGTLSEQLRSGYSAPELFEAKSVVGDIYALGATMYFYVTNTKPKPSTRRLEAHNQQGHDPLPSIFSLAGPAANKGLLKTINLMLNPAMKERPQSVDEVLAILNQYLPDSASAKDYHSASNNGAEGVQAMPLTWLASVVGILLLLGLGFWFITQKTPDTEIAKGIQPNKTIVDRGVEQKRAKYEEVSMPAQAPAPVIDSIVKQDVINKAEEEPVVVEMVTSETEQLVDTPDTTQLSLPQNITAESEVEQASQAKSDEILTDISTSVGALPKVEPVTQVVETLKTSSIKSDPDETNVTRSERAEDPVSQSAKADENIASHIATATDNIESFKLTTPEEQNAYDHLQAVLAVDPENIQALEGMQRVVDKYAWLIEKSINQNELENAKVYLNRARKISPDDAKLAELQEKLQNQKK